MSRSVRLAVLVLIVATVGCDRVTKHFAAETLAAGPAQSFMMDTVRLEYMENTGAFLSLGANWPVEIRTAVFTAGNAVLLLLVVVAAVRGRWQGTALIGMTMFVAGGTSNLVDRILRGSVIDFMNVGIGPLRTGIFNVADMAIMLGGALAASAVFRSNKNSAHLRIFLAGAGGAVGRPLCRLLIADGHHVVGTTRSTEKAAMLRAMGVEAVVVDVFDAAALRRAVVAARPNVVIHQLTDLPPALEPALMPAALIRNARIRDEGTRNLVAAAVEAGATRMIAQSIAFSVTGALLAFERQVLDAPLDGIILRYGKFYGPGTGFDTPSATPPTVHVDAAAEAARHAVTHLAPGRYGVTDQDGTFACGEDFGR